MFKKMDEWNESPELKNQFPRLALYLRHVFNQLGQDEQDQMVDDHINNIKSKSNQGFMDFIKKMETS